MSRSGCLVCGAVNVEVLLELPRVPALCNVAWRTRAEARDAPHGRMRLGFCSACEHVFNADFDPGLVSYAEGYENSLHFSDLFRGYARELAAHLVASYGLRGKDIIDIGCGQGEFLDLLCTAGANRGYGFDPAYAGGASGPGPSERVLIVRSLFSEEHRAYPADFVCCRHVLEHVEEPRALLATLRRVLQDRPDTPVFFEVPDGAAMMRDAAIWDLIYEHRSYFTASSLARAFEECGFEIRSVRPLFGGQYLGLEAVPARSSARRSAVGADLVGLRREAPAFAARYHDKVRGWTAALEGALGEGRRLIVWGAGSKGVMFLNTVGAGGSIDYVVDVNLRKQGKYVAGTGQEIVPPEFLREYRPDLVIVMNSIYLKECQAITEGLGVHSSFECA